jgi:hypothetical protein
METAECVPLLQAVEEICARGNVDPNGAQQIIRDRHQLGDLDLRLRRPDGSVTDLPDRSIWDPSPWGDPDDWKSLFIKGEIEAERRPRPNSLRRVQRLERCRIVVTRASLKRFLQTMPAATQVAENRAANHLKPLLEQNKNMRKSEAREAVKSFNISEQGFDNRVWPTARHLAGLPHKASGGRKPGS